MADVYEPEIRSYTMSRIRKTDTKPEVLVRRFLFKEGFRFRIHVRALPGNPDIVLKRYKTVIFVNGCFWHAHDGCRLNKLPKSRQEYWHPKIMKNVKRDFENIQKLRSVGWKVLTVWECELAHSKRELTLSSLSSAIK